MPTNIGLLPQIQGSLPPIVKNGDWRWSIQFVQANNPATPVDITGIAFELQLRSKASDPQVFLDTSTALGNVTNGDTNGTLTWGVPQSALVNITNGNYLADLIAVADGKTINLCAGSPLTVSVGQGITR